MLSLAPGAYGFEIAILLISIMLLLGGIILGIGTAIDDVRIKAFGKEEIVQTMVNGVLVGSLLLLFVPHGIVMTIVNSAVNSSGLYCPIANTSNQAICLAEAYLVGTVPFQYNGALHLSILSQATNSIPALLGISLTVGSIPLLSNGAQPLLEEIDELVKAFSAVAVGALVQGAVLEIISASAVTLLLPIGLILRTFYPTRKLGGFFIALTLGLYLVLPLSYVLGLDILSTQASFAPVSNSTLLGTIGSVTNSTNSTGIGVKLGSLWSSFIDPMLDSISSAIVYTFILPAFGLVLTGISVKEFAQVLGSDINFGKFKLV